MDDGSKKWSNKGLAMRFCTDSYSEQEINFLIHILNSKFNLNITKIKNNRDQWRLYVGTNDYEKFKTLIYPHIIPSMKYKFPRKFNG